MQADSTLSPIRAYLPFMLAGILIATVFIAGCTTQPASAGTTTAPATVVPVSVSEIVKDPTAFEGKEVEVKGKITNECGSGCWFMLDDGTGTIYVDLNPNNFAIPQLQGSTVAVKGVINVINGDPQLYASTVATDSRTYP